MIPSGYNAWKRDETIQQWCEVVFDTSMNPMKHTGYVCKCCWEQFEAKTNAITLSAHAGRHQSHGESVYSTARPSPITGEQVWDLFHALSEHYQRVMPQAGTWKLQCRKCLKLLPHRTPHQELMIHARTCSNANPQEGIMRLTDPSYISEQMFDKMLREKLQENPEDDSVRLQALKFMQLVRRSKARNGILADIMHAAKVSEQTSVEQVAEIAFCMGLQFGFELALSYPPLPSN